MKTWVTRMKSFESFAQPDQGTMKKKIKGKAEYKRYPGKGGMKKHANVKDDCKKDCEGRNKNLGTTD